MEFLVPAACGVALAVALLFAVRRVSEERQRQILAIGLAVAAALYVVFAVVARAGDWILVELIFAIAFSLMAFVTMRSSLLLGVAWALHTGWDLIHYRYMEGAIAPTWYPPLCLTFDLVVALHLVGAAAAGLRRNSP